MTYDTEAPKGFLIVGQGDGVVEEWISPFSDLEEIEAVITRAIQYGIFIPWKTCTANTRTFRRLTADRGYESALDLIKGHPHVELYHESYGEDDDIPGRSGSFLMVLVRKHKARSFLNQINKLQDNLLDFWESSGGLDLEIDGRKNRKEKTLRQKQAKIKADRQRAAKIDREEKQTFESLVSTLLDEIRKFQASSKAPYLYPDCTKRVLCVNNGPVYILEYDPYDSEKTQSETRLLADRLDQCGFIVQRLRQHQPKDVGHIPYFAGQMRSKYQGWLQQEGLLASDDSQIAADATEHRAQFLELSKRGA